VHPRDVFADNPQKPLLPARWAGAVDTVGGTVLATLLKSIHHRGCVATCGMVGGVELNTSVYPFILRGVKLDGIDSAQCPLGPRHEIWRRLSDEWRLPDLDRITNEVPLTSLTAAVSEILAGMGVGRTVVKVTG
jgi:acrylyl-CoA reductase (NADPH)